MRAITAASLTVVDGIWVNKDTGRVIDYRSLRTNRRQEKKKSHSKMSQSRSITTTIQLSPKCHAVKWQRMRRER